jgi:assimilatory nitrate reductase catalytic subunit
VNTLTNDAVCTQSQQPELKFSAVRLEAVSIVDQLYIMVWCKPGQAQSVRRQLVTAFEEADFSYAGLFNTGTLAQQNDNHSEGVLLRVVHHEAISLRAVEALEMALGIDAKTLLRYQDVSSLTQRRIAITNNQMQYLMIKGNQDAQRAQQWLGPLLQECTDIGQLRSSLLAPTPPQTTSLQSDPTVCQCFGVRASQIDQWVSDQAAASDGNLLKNLQAALRCGTECGSCLPQLQRMIQTRQELAGA